MSKNSGLMSKRSRRWVFTVWNPTEADLETLRVTKKPVLGVVGLESPQDGDSRQHLQGYARFKDAITGSAVKKWLGRNDAHLEIQTGNDWDNHVYCTKEGATVVQWGETPAETSAKQTHADWDFAHDQISRGKGILSVIDNKPHMTRYIAALRQLQTEKEVKMQEAWRDVKTTYLWGSAGVGKSRAIMEKHGHENVYRVTDKKNPWDGYRGEDVVVFEEYRSNFGVENMLNWLDGYPIMLPCRYANRPATFTRVYIVTNITLEEQFQNVQEQHPETWGAFLRRIDDVVFGCAQARQFTRWETMRDFCEMTGQFGWISLLKGASVTMENSLTDLL